MKWAWPAIWADERGGWWRLVLTFVLSEFGKWLGAAVAVTAAMCCGLGGTLKNQQSLAHNVVELGAGLVAAALMLVGCLIGVRLVHHKPVACVFTDGQRFNFGLAVQSAGVWALLWFAGTVSLPNGWGRLVRRAGEIPPTWWLVLSVIAIAVIAVQATGEEVLFRGYLQTRVAAWVRRPWLAVCISTLVFTAAHIHANLPGRVGIAALGIAFGVACVRAGTVAPLAGAHAAQNTLSWLWFPQETIATVTWLDVVFVVVELSIWFGWLLWATRTSRSLAGTRMERNPRPPCPTKGSSQ